MERYTMFLDWKNQCCENHCTTQSNLLIQCNPYQITNGIFHRSRTRNFFHQCLIVFCIQVFCLLRQVYSQVFYSFCCNAKWEYFLDFAFRFFIISVQECKRCLCINFLPCYFTKFIDQLQQFSGSIFRILYVQYHRESANSDSFTSSFLIWIPFISNSS